MRRLAGRPCRATFLAEYGYVPPFKSIGGRVTESQVFAAALCDDCSRRYTKSSRERTYRLPQALARIRKNTAKTSLRERLETSSSQSSDEAARAERQAEADRRHAAQRTQAERLIARAQRPVSAA